MNKFIYINALVVILSSWWWVIIRRDFGAGILVLTLSLLVFLYFYKNRSRKLLLVLLTVTAILFFIAAKGAFDKTLFQNSALDTQKYNRRFEFYAKDLGKIYTNRISLAYFEKYDFLLVKLQRNFFANLDPNLYFFSSHPRERLGIEEFKKYSLIFLPFFLIGIFYSIYILLPSFLFYAIIVSLLSLVISPKYNLGPILFFPLINYFITVGIIISLERGLIFLKKRR